MLKTEISVAVAAIADCFAGLSIGETATYPTLSALIGKDIRQHRWIIDSARKVAARDFGAVVANERLVGYVRLATGQLPDVGSTARLHVRRTSRRASNVIRWGADRANDLRPVDQRRINAELSATWTKKFESGITLLDDPLLRETPQGPPLAPDSARMIAISAGANGKRGPGTRVTRRFPVWDKWATTFDVHILDPAITRDVFKEMVEIAGIFIGIGRFRPQNAGGNGRFQVARLEWVDNRVFDIAAE
jgi:hypothetical protein